MPIDRIKCFGIQLGLGYLAIFKCGKLKFQAKENKWETQLIDGENVEGPLWIHLSFDILVMYLHQQLISDDIPQALKDEEDGTLPTFASGVDLKEVLDDIYKAEVTPIYFYPRLLDQDGTVNVTKYRVLGDKDTIDLIDAKTNGRFDMYTALSLKTKTPLTEYPSWINRG